MAKKKTFESALKELEEVVKEMESGELPLEDAMKKYEMGMKHLKYCQDLLDKTEKKISVFTRDENGTITAMPFEEK